MAAYKGIQGYTVQTLSSDPTASEAAGQLWYNSGSGKFKVGTEGAGAWASGGNLNTGRNTAGSAGAAAATSMLIFGGNTGSPELITGNTESYNGSAWTETGHTMNTPRRECGGIGDSQTAALIGGGYSAPAGGVVANCETYNGSTWTEVNNILVAKSAVKTAHAGTSTAGLFYGGGPSTASNQSWDGTSWTELADMNTAKGNQARFGTQTAALTAGGGNPGGRLSETETWNGTSWTETNNLTTARESFAGAGSTTAGMAYGGDTPGVTAKTETWDGTSWTEVGDLPTAIQAGAGGGASSSASALSTGGNPGYTNATNEWTEPIYTNKTVTVS